MVWRPGQQYQNVPLALSFPKIPERTSIGTLSEISRNLTGLFYVATSTIGLGSAGQGERPLLMKLGGSASRAHQTYRRKYRVSQKNAPLFDLQYLCDERTNIHEI